MWVLLAVADVAAPVAAAPIAAAPVAAALAVAGFERMMLPLQFEAGLHKHLPQHPPVLSYRSFQ